MAKPNSSKLREQIVDSIRQGMSIAEAVETYQVARRTIYYYLQRDRLQNKTPRAAGARSGPKSSLQNDRTAILAARQAHPDLSMRELCELLKLTVSPSNLSRTIAAWNLEAQQEEKDNS